MIVSSNGMLKAGACAASLLAGLLVTSCMATSPQQVDSSRPTVTYKYHNDDELAKVNQRASDYCGRYQRSPRVVSNNDASDGRDIVFECTRTASMDRPQQSYDHNLTFTFRTDSELADATRNAEQTCRNGGMRQTNSHTVANDDGSKTITFQCG